MAEIRIPFCATAELAPPFVLDETYSEPGGVKSVLFDASRLYVAGRMETVEIPEVGPIRICIYKLAGTIEYICNAFPVIQSDTKYKAQQQTAAFDETSATWPRPAW